MEAGIGIGVISIVMGSWVLSQYDVDDEGAGEVALPAFHEVLSTAFVVEVEWFALVFTWACTAPP